MGSRALGTWWCFRQGSGFKYNWVGRRGGGHFLFSSLRILKPKITARFQGVNLLLLSAPNHDKKSSPQRNNNWLSKHFLTPLPLTFLFIPFSLTPLYSPRTTFCSISVFWEEANGTLMCYSKSSAYKMSRGGFFFPSFWILHDILQTEWV